MKPDQQNELKKREESFRVIFENAVDGIFISDAEGIFTDVNQSAHRLLGYEPGELIGKSIVEVLPPQEIERFFAARESLLAGDQKFEEWMLLRRDGSLVETEISSQMLPDGRLAGFTRDITERKSAEDLRRRAEQALREKKDLLQAVFDFSTELIHIKDLEGRCVMSNHVFQKALQLSENDILGKTEIELWQASPSLQGNTRKSIEDYRDFDLDVFETGKIAEKEEVFLVGDDERVFLTIKCPLYDQAGKPYVIFSISTDITERRRAENELLAKQQLLQAIVDTSSALIHVQDLDNRAILANRSFAELMHLAPEEMLGKTDYELWEMSPVTDGEPQMEIDAYRAFDAETLDAGNSMEKVLSISLIGSGKRYFLTNKSLLRDDSGKPHSICTIATEITERKRAEDELRAKQELLQTIFDNSPAIINVKDLDGRCLMANKSFEDMLSLSEEEIIGKTGNELWETSPTFSGDSKNNIDSYRAFELEAINAGKALHREDISTFNGEQTYLTTKCPLRDGAGKPHSVLTIATDITEVKRAEKELRRLQGDLAHAARVMTMGALTNSIAHEVNQPLAGVVTNANACLRWLAQEPPVLNEARDAVQRIIRDGNRAGDVIAHARALLKNNAPQKSALDINEIVRETITLAQHEIQKNKILLQTRFSSELPMVAADKIQLQQVLLNLLINSIEAINAASSSSSSSGGGEEKRLSIETRKIEADKIGVAVNDSGAGLVPEEIENIFEAFYTTKTEGMGMGLSISRSIIEAHGGRIWATANGEKGATFQFTLPVETYEE